MSEMERLWDAVKIVAGPLWDYEGVSFAEMMERPRYQHLRNKMHEADAILNAAPQELPERTDGQSARVGSSQYPAGAALDLVRRIRRCIENLNPNQIDRERTELLGYAADLIEKLLQGWNDREQLITALIKENPSKAPPQ